MGGPREWAAELPGGVAHVVQFVGASELGRPVCGSKGHDKFTVRGALACLQVSRRICSRCQAVEGKWLRKVPA